MVKKLFGFVKVPYRGLKKNTLQLKGAVYAVQSVDGLAPIDGKSERSGPESRQMGLNRTKGAKHHLEDDPEKPELKPAVSFEQYRGGNTLDVKLLRPSWAALVLSERLARL